MKNIIIHFVLRQYVPVYHKSLMVKQIQLSSDKVSIDHQSITFLGECYGPQPSACPEFIISPTQTHYQQQINVIAVQ